MKSNTPRCLRFMGSRGLNIPRFQVMVLLES